MSESHRAEHQQSAGDYYAQTQQRLQQNAARFGSEDRPSAEKGITGETQKEASAYSVTQGNQLLEGQTTRDDAPVPGQNYAAASHEDLYNMVHQGLDLEEINDRSRVTNTYGNWLADASNAFRDAANTAGASWQGGAASQANSFFQSTASHTEQTGNAMQLVSNRYSQQSAAADYAQKNMPEPTGFNQQAEINKATTQLSNGDPAGSALTMNNVANKQQQADAAHQHAVQVMQGLDSTYHGTATTQPTYAPPPQIGAPDSSTHISSADSGGGVGTHGSGVGAPGGSSYNPAGGQPGGGQPGVGTGGAGSSYTPGSGASTGAGNIGGPPGGGGGFRGPGGGGGFGRVTPDALAMGGPPGGGGSGGGDITRSRPGIGSGRSGGGFAGSRVSGGGYKPGEVEEPGKGTGKGAAGERLERGGTAAANAGKVGKAGEGGAAGNAAGKKKEEDKEHKNKIPTQVDPDEVFEVRPERGPDGEKITPPVIGG
ncbi:hypothetical protein [Amycolatopsis sp. NBC_01480]|uniref:hypothetical protein n=1 Tax=Amycolatopsis sp. NBC_01480 TaxID=2903562 RepID=UPI002E2D5731|nr:hypothetical protein [Amycolatopsis sp. NBC_01480]